MQELLPSYARVPPDDLLPVTTTNVRNVLEEPVEIIDPLERKTVQTFDAAGNRLTKTDPDGRTTTYGYDKADRLLIPEN